MFLLLLLEPVVFLIVVMFFIDWDVAFVRNNDINVLFLFIFVVSLVVYVSDIVF